MLDASSVIGVCGAGAMGAGIAQVAAQAGHHVIVLDRDETALSRGRAVVGQGAAALLKRGKINQAEARSFEERVNWTLNIEDFSEAVLVIEAIIEKVEAKKSLYEALEAVIAPGAIIATNTSSLPVTRLASSLHHPTRFMGLHFFNPAPIMKLVEVVAGLDTDEGKANAALNLMHSWGKVAVMVSDVPGFIVNRVARPFYGEGWRAFEEGIADAATLDFLYRDLARFRMGPFELGDLIGHDINCAAAKSVFESYFSRTRFRPSLLQGQLVEAGRLGRKTGRGVFDYSESAETPAPHFGQEDSGKLKSIAVGTEVKEMRKLLDCCSVSYEELDDPEIAGQTIIDDVLVYFTKGKSARQLAYENSQSCITLDWMRDPNSASVLAYSASDERAAGIALKLASTLGKKVVELGDRPGMVVFRTLAQLANCAGDAVRDQVADATSIDKAMMNGVNYPFGPMAWARDYGFQNLCSALDDIAWETSDELYRPSEAMRIAAAKE